MELTDEQLFGTKMDILQAVQDGTLTIETATPLIRELEELRLRLHEDVDTAELPDLVSDLVKRIAASKTLPIISRCPESQSTSKTNPLLGWIILAGIIGLVIVPYVSRKPARMPTPAERRAARESYLRQFESDDERLEFEDQVEAERELRRIESDFRDREWSPY